MKLLCERVSRHVNFTSQNVQVDLFGAASRAVVAQSCNEANIPGEWSEREAWLS